MELFLDTADINTIRALIDSGIVSGVTTNPAIMRGQFPEYGNTADDYYGVTLEFCKKFFHTCGDVYRDRHVEHPLVNLEIYSLSIDDSVDFISEQILRIASLVDSACASGDIAPCPGRIAIKIPSTRQALGACKKIKGTLAKRFARFEILINTTLCFSPNQALVAALSGADYVSLFVGRLEDNGIDGIKVMSDIVDIYQKYQLKTKLLVASVRNADHVYKASMVGAQAITMPTDIFKSLYDHELTNSGLESFCKKWLTVK